MTARIVTYEPHQYIYVDGLPMQEQETVIFEVPDGMTRLLKPVEQNQMLINWVQDQIQEHIIQTRRKRKA